MVRTDNNPNCSSFERVFHQHKDMVYSIALAAVRTLTVRERLMRFLFGDKIKLTVIVPGNSVKGICIREIPDMGGNFGQANALVKRRVTDARD